MAERKLGRIFGLQSQFGLYLGLKFV